MNKVLITGGAGFIGYHLAGSLSARGYQVDLLDNLSRGVVDQDLEKLINNRRVRLIKASLLKSDALDNLENDYRYIFHLAAIVGVDNVLKRPYDVLCDNVLMLLNVVSLAKRQTDLHRLVFASTSEVYAGTLKHFTLTFPTPESTPLALTDLSYPRTSYMLSKIYGESLCWHSGSPCTVIRPHNIYGPRMGMSHVIPQLLKKAHDAGEYDSLEVFSVDHLRTFCYVDDAVEMIERAAVSSACTGQILNIGNQSPEITIGRLARLILKVVGKDLKIMERPPTTGSPERRCPDMTMTNGLINYQCTVGLEEGIQFTYEWYRNRVFEGNGISGK